MAISKLLKDLFHHTKTSVQTSFTAQQVAGQLAEKAAFNFLRRQGLKQQLRNFLCKQGEIDLIMTDQQQLVFIEVRYRSSNSHGSALESVDQHKQNKVRKAAEVYLQQVYGNNPPSCRFDVVSIEPNRSPQWIKNAF